MTNVEKEIPLFPLGAVVLFPDMPLNLRIFEERYKQLVTDVLETEPIFGIVLIKEGKEVGQAAKPRAIGTIARIIEATPLDNGNFYLSMMGLERFEIMEIVRSVPYLVAKVQMLEDTSPDVPSEILTAAQDSFSEYVRSVTAAQGGWVRPRGAPCPRAEPGPPAGTPPAPPGARPRAWPPPPPRRRTPPPPQS